MTQLALAFFGLSAMWLSMGHNPLGRKWAPVVGLAGQPFWLWFSVSANAWGLFALSLAYTAVYVRGAWVQWRPKPPDPAVVAFDALCKGWNPYAELTAMAQAEIDRIKARGK
jgi:hypothetical protein